MKRRRSILALGLGAATGALVGCSSDAPGPAPMSSGATPPVADVPAGLCGVGVVPAPAALFALCRDSYDLPVTGSSWAAFAVSMLGLPITAAEAFDLAGQIRVALLGAEGQAPIAVVVALPLRAPDRLIAVATLGESARFRSLKDEALVGERLIPTGGDASLELGALRNHLVVGAAGTLARAGAFLSDPTQAAFARTTEQISGWVHGEALAGLLRSQLERVGEKMQALARAAVPEIDTVSSALASLREIPFEATLSTTTAALRLTLPNREAIGALSSALGRGELGPVLATDRDADVAVALFQPEAERLRAAEWMGSVLPLFGVASRPSEAMREGLVALARARADGFQLALERGPAGVLAYGSCDLDDEDAARAALALLTKAGGELKNGLGATIGIVDTRLSLIGEAVHVFVDREEPAGGSQAEPTKKRLASVLMRVEGGRLAIATGRDTVAALKKALRRRSEEGPASLAELGVVKAIVPVLPAHLAAFAFFDPARLLAATRPSGDPERDRSALGLSVEVTTDSVALTLALEPLAMRALGRQAQGTL